MKRENYVTRQALDRHPSKCLCKAEKRLPHPPYPAERVAARVKIAALLGLGLLVLAQPADAEHIIKRSQLMRACTGKSPAELNDCSGYIAGVADLAADPPPGAKAEVCFTGPVTLKILRESVTLFLQGHPGPDGPAVPPVYEALKTLYKC